MKGRERRCPRWTLWAIGIGISGFGAGMGMKLAGWSAGWGNVLAMGELVCFSSIMALMAGGIGLVVRMGRREAEEDREADERKRSRE